MGLLRGHVVLVKKRRQTSSKGEILWRTTVTPTTPQPTISHPSQAPISRAWADWSARGMCPVQRYMDGSSSSGWRAVSSSSSASISTMPDGGQGHRDHRARTAVRCRAERGDKVALLQQHGRYPRLRVRTGGGHPHDLGWGEGFPGVLQGHIQRRRRHPHRRLALPGGGGYEATSTRVEQTWQDAVS